MVAPTKWCTLNGVTEGATVSAASTATGSGDPLPNNAGTAADVVALAAAAIKGTRGARLSATTAVSSFFNWTLTTPNASLGTRVYFRINSAAGSTPVSANLNLLQIRNNNATPATVANVILNTSGVLLLQDAGGATPLTYNGGTALPDGDYHVWVAATKGSTTSNGRILSTLRKASDDSVVGSTVDNSSVNTGLDDMSAVRFPKSNATGTVTQLDFDEPAYVVGSVVEIDRVTSNVAPTASISVTPGLTVSSYKTVTLDSSGSTDPDGTIVSRAWSQLSGPAVTLSSTTAVAPTFTSPALSTDQTLVFQLVVTDNNGATGTTTVSITVTHHTYWLAGATTWSQPVRVTTL